MNLFIRFPPSKHQVPMSINPNHIVAIVPYMGEGARLALSNGEDFFTTLLEAEVERLIHSGDA